MTLVEHSFLIQVTPCEAVCISMGVFVFSVLISTPFTVYTKLTKIFDEPGAYDHISFCLEDLPQSGQVKNCIFDLLVSLLYTQTFVLSLVKAPYVLTNAMYAQHFQINAF